jgi:hypothetical protein
MCKEMPVILVNKVVDPKRIEAQGVADSPPPKKKKDTLYPGGIRSLDP